MVAIAEQKRELWPLNLVVQTIRSMSVVWCCVAFGALAVACGSDGSSTPAATGGTIGVTAGGSAGTGATVGGAQSSAGSISMPGGGDSVGGSGTPAGGVGGSASGGQSATGGQTAQDPSAPMFPALLQNCDVAAAQDHADRALAANLLDFWSGNDDYLNAIAPTDGKLTGYWTYAQVFDALLDGVERTGGLKYRGLIDTFYNGRAARGWLVDYYDDEAWMTMALMRAFDLTGDARFLTTAEMIYQDIMAQWDTTCCGTHKGGIWWDKKHSSKATASNAGPVIAGVRLAKRTNKTTYLDFAKQAYAFWMSDMVDQTSWAIYDHLNTDGSRGSGALTYNHGIMIGSGIELNAATGEAHYLTEANNFAHYMMAHATKMSSLGPVLNDFGNTCTGDCAAWKGIGYRYLALLFRNDPTHADYATFLANNANAVWMLAHDPATDLFNSNWAGPAPTSGGVEAQGSAAMALNLYAIMCGSDPKAVWPAAGVYEAEEGILNHVGLEAKSKGFSGFGYVAAFSKDKQSVSFDINATTAGPYTLKWVYSAATGAATRSVLVGGTLVTAQAFAATANADTWANAQTNVDLLQGKNTVELRFDAAKSGAGALNLDRVELSAR